MASYLGKGDRKTAYDIVARVLRLAAGIGALLAVALLAGRQTLPTVFTSDPAVQGLVTMVGGGFGSGCSAQAAADDGRPCIHGDHPLQQRGPITHTHIGCVTPPSSRRCSPWWPWACRWTR